MNTGLNANLVSNPSALSKSLTAQFHKEAVAKGWPANLAELVTIKVTNNGIVASYPDKQATAIEDLEYGTVKTHPLAILRTFIDKHEAEVFNHLVEGTTDYLFSKGILP